MANQTLQVSEGLEVIPSATVRIPNPGEVVILDIATGASVGVAAFTAGTLTDVGTSFLDANIKVGAIIYNTTAGIAYNVVSVDSDTAITIFPATAGGATDSYTIYNGATKGCLLYVGGEGSLTVQMAQQNGNTSTLASPANREVTLINVPDASFLPLHVVKVSDTTTATSVIALW